MAAYLQGFRAEYLLQRFDWLELPEWLAARNPFYGGELAHSLCHSAVNEPWKLAEERKETGWQGHESVKQQQ